MAPQLSSSPLIERERLSELVDLRLREARVLFEAGLFVGAVHLAGFAVECGLKHAICLALGWDKLRRTFQTHDLELLLLHSGLDSLLRSEATVKGSYSVIKKLWNIDSDSNIRYAHASEVDRQTAELFLSCIEDPESGVIPWLRKTTS